MMERSLWSRQAGQWVRVALSPVARGQPWANGRVVAGDVAVSGWIIEQRRCTHVAGGERWLVQWEGGEMGVCKPNDWIREKRRR